MSPLEERMELVNFSSVRGLLEVLRLEPLHDLLLCAAEGELVGNPHGLAATDVDRFGVEALALEIGQVPIQHLLLMSA
jgi:hypothetical protein